MRHIAIVGSGPAGYYTAEAAQKQWGDTVRVDIFDSQPVPFGLIRTGVAPDHQAIKGVSRRYEATARLGNVRFVGNVMLGRDVSVAELQDLYDAVILATGAPHDRRLGLPGEDLANVFGSAAFVGWYNGHAEHAGLAPDLAVDSAAIVGHGNVALDVCRLLVRSFDDLAVSDIPQPMLHAFRQRGIREVHLLGRGGPGSMKFTFKEFRQLADLPNVRIRLPQADSFTEAMWEQADSPDARMMSSIVVAWRPSFWKQVHAASRICLRLASRFSSEIFGMA